MVVLFLWQHLHVIRRAYVCGSAQSLKQAIVDFCLDDEDENEAVVD